MTIMTIIIATLIITILKFMTINMIMLFDEESFFFCLQILEIIKIKNKTTITIGRSFR